MNSLKLKPLAKRNGKDWGLLLLSLLLTSCFGVTSGVGSSSENNVSVSISNAKITHGTVDTEFQYIVTFSGSETFNLQVEDIELVSANVSCDLPSIDSSNPKSIVVKVQNCSGVGSLRLKIKEGALLNLSSQVLTSDSVYVTNGAACPTGYIPVPGNQLYETDYFCVMKYEARLLYDSNGDSDFSDASLVANGNVDGTYNYNNDYSNVSEVVKYKAVSVANAKPWVRIRNRNDGAREACRYLNTIEGVTNKYDLITSDEWQTVARNIELNQSGTYSNLVTDSFGDTIFNHGHADADPNESCDSLEEYVDTDCSDSGSELDFSEKRTHFLTNKEVIWDFAGNIAEHVQGYGGAFYTSNSYLSQVSDDNYTQSFTITESNVSGARLLKELFGPIGDYLNASTNNYGGLGFATINFSGGAIQRGGHWSNGEKAGVFNSMTSDNGNLLYTNVGFRCVYRP